LHCSRVEIWILKLRFSLFFHPAASAARVIISDYDIKIAIPVSGFLKLY
jgi:hypothetical protein